MAGGLVNIDTAGIGSLISGVGSAAKDIRAAITGKSIIDPAAEAALEEKLAELEGKAADAQSAVNQIEAASPKLFIAGWRPAVGWICACALALNYLVFPFLKLFGLVPPPIAMQDLIGILLGMLGLGTQRTIEKVKGAEGNR